MRVIKKSIAAILCAAMVVTLAPAGSADAAKKPKLKKKASVEVGKTVTIKVKNAKKKAKVTWKTSKKAVAKITKKVAKGKKASAVVQGVSEGKAKITAVYKLGKTKKKLTCTVTVKAAGQQAPVASPTANGGAVQGSSAPQQTVAPTQPGGDADNTAAPGEPTATPTVRPTRTPSPVPTASPTPLPDDKEYNFEVPENGYAIDVSTYVSASGSGGYNAEKQRVEINDGSSADNSQGSWALPPEIAGSIKTGDIVTFRVQGYNYGDSGFRFWLGTPTSGGCTPVMLLNEIDESLAIDPELGYPCVKEEDGTVLEGQSGEAIQSKATYNQMAINADPDTKAFDVEFKFKAGTSQDDVAATFTHLTLKYIFSGGTVGYINGLSIKNIYFITDKAIETPPTMDPDTPGIDISGATKPYGEGEVTTNEDGTVTGTGCDIIAIPLGMDIADGEEVKVTVFGEADAGMRIWLADKANKRWSDIQNPALFGTTYTFVANKNIAGESADSSETTANCFHIKGLNYGDKLNITVTKVVVSKDEPGAEVAGDAVDLSSEDSYIKDESQGGVSTSYADDALDLTLNQFGGIVFKAPADKTYKYAQITYTGAKALQAYLFDDTMTDGKGQNATGQHQSTDLAAATEETTVTYEAGADYSGNCIKGIKIVNVDFNDSAAKTLKIKSIKFFEENPVAE